MLLRHQRYLKKITTKYAVLHQIFLGTSEQWKNRQMFPTVLLRWHRRLLLCTNMSILISQESRRSWRRSGWCLHRWRTAVLFNGRTLKDRVVESRDRATRNSGGSWKWRRGLAACDDWGYKGGFAKYSEAPGFGLSRTRSFSNCLMRLPHNVKWK